MSTIISISHGVGYSCDVGIRGFNAPIRFYFESSYQRKVFSELISEHSRVKIRKGRPSRVTHYDLDITRMNVFYYFGGRIAEMVYS